MVMNMTMACPDCSSWLTVRSPTATSLSLKPHYFFFFVSSKKASVFPCCSTGSTDSSSSSSPSTRSYAQRWYNPLRRRNFDPALEIERHWVEADNQALTSTERFTVVSYNILADRNAYGHRDLYLNVPSQYLKWSHRKRVICEELLGLNPDIICLQEVDKYLEISNTLVKAGYLGSYKRRTGDTIDGCAMFWKADKFRLLEGDSIEFKGIGLRDNVAQLSVFEIRSLLSRAQALSEKWGNPPVVFAGDFNSTPQSGIYKFLSSSELNIMLYDRRELSGQKNCHPAQVLGNKKETINPFLLMDKLFKNWTYEEVMTATGNSKRPLAVHPFKLNSSYATIKGSARTRGFNDEPLATSYHSKFLGTVDYLWYSDSIIPTKVLDTVPINILWRAGGLPGKRVGSDHLALVSEFAFSLTTNATTELDNAAAEAATSSPSAEN